MILALPDPTPVLRGVAASQRRSRVAWITRVLHRRRMIGLSFCCALPLPACVTVDPRADYRRAQELVTQQTGVRDSYDPAGEQEIAQRVHQLLEHGLSINDATSIALLNNKGLQSLFQEIGIARADVVQSGLPSNPTLSFGVRFPEGGGRSELTAGLAQQIVDLWQIPIRKRIAEARLEQTILLLAQRAQELAGDVRRRYYGLVASERAVALGREHAALTQRSLDVAQARFDVGEADALEVNLARGSLLNIRTELTRLEGDQEVAEIALARSLGLSRSYAPWTLSNPLPQPRSLDSDRAALLSRAASGRLDVRSGELAVQAAEDEFIRQCRNVFPSIVLGITGERTERAPIPGRDVLADTARASVAAGQLTAPSIQSRSQREQARSQAIDALLGATVSMTLPLWDQNQAGISKARFAVVQRRKDLENLHDDIALAVGHALIRTRTLAAVAVMYEAEVQPNDTANIEGARALYETGQQNILVLLDAQEALTTHQRRYVEALRDYAVAIVDLELAVGAPLDLSGERPADSTNEQD